MLDAFGFIRTHQTHLINPKHIESFIKRDGGYIKMINGDSVPVSRLRKQQVLNQLNQ